MGIIFDDNHVEGDADKTLPSRIPDTVGTGYTELARDASVEIKVYEATDVASVDSTSASSHALYTADDAPANADYDVALEIGSVPGSNDDALVLLFRVQDASNFYYAIGYRGAASPDLRLGKVVADVVTNLDNGNLGGLTGATEFRIKGRGEDLEVLVDSVLKLSATDAAHSAKGLGGWGMGNVEIAGDDVGSPWELTRFFIDEVPAPAGSAPPPNASLM